MEQKARLQKIIDSMPLDSEQRECIHLSHMSEEEAKGIADRLERTLENIANFVEKLGKPR